jgi:hypothetical protein
MNRDRSVKLQQRVVPLPIEQGKGVRPETPHFPFFTLDIKE